MKQPIKELSAELLQNRKQRRINKITYLAFTVETDQISYKLKAGYTTENKHETNPQTCFNTWLYELKKISSFSLIWILHENTLFRKYLLGLMLPIGLTTHFLNQCVTF